MAFDPMALAGNPLFAAGTALMGASGPSLTPINPLAAVGPAMARSAQNAMLMKQFQRQEEEWKARQAEQQQRQQYAASLATRAQAPYVAIGGPLPEDAAGWARELMGSGVPELQAQGIKALTSQKERAPIKVGNQLVDPVTFKPVFTGQVNEPAAIQTYRMAHPEDPQLKGFDRWSRANKAAGATTVNTYGSPIPAVDANGNPVFIQPSKTGGEPSVIPGYAPPPKQINAKDAQTARGKIMAAQNLKRQIQNARAAFDEAKNSFMTTGIVGGLNPISRSGQEFDASINALRSSVSALTRTPGVGSMSDYETRLDQSKIPDRTRYDAVTAQQLDELEALADGVISGYSDMIGGAPTAGASGAWQPAEQSAAPQAGSKPGAVKWEDLP